MNDDNVHVIVNNPCNPEIITYETYTSKMLLCNIPKFKQWFDSVEMYGDYIEIGNEGYSGLSNLMLFNKNDSLPYLLSINCDRYAHDLGMYNPPIIDDLISYCKFKNKIFSFNYRTYPIHFAYTNF